MENKSWLYNIQQLWNIQLNLCKSLSKLWNRCLKVYHTLQNSSEDIIFMQRTEFSTKSRHMMPICTLINCIMMHTLTLNVLPRRHFCRIEQSTKFQYQAFHQGFVFPLSRSYGLLCTLTRSLHKDLYNSI